MDHSNNNFIRDKNKVIIILGKYLKEVPTSERLGFLEMIRKKYFKVIFFEDNAGCEGEFFHFMPYFNLYFKKQLFKDRSLYFNPLYGNKLFTDFYHRKYLIDDLNRNPENTPLKEEHELDKLRLAWNLGLGKFHLQSRINKIHHFKKLFKIGGPKLISWTLGKFPFEKECPSPDLEICHARFKANPKRGIIDFQRKLLIDTISNDSRFLTGTIPKEKYFEEIKRVKLVLSPFGYGEICFRDFEAILNGAVLIKPDMSHIQTFPDIYLPNKTYIPIYWDGSNLINTVSEILINKEKLNLIRNEAWNCLKNEYLNLDSIVERFLIEIEKTN
ncbi:MAG: hypothetical protein ACXIUD_07130 [Mongoliitalea sp.]